MAPKKTTTVVAAPIVAPVVAPIHDVKADKEVKKAKKIAEVAVAEVEEKPKKVKKTEVMRADDVIQALIDTGRVNIDEFTTEFGKKVSIKSKFTTKQKKDTQRTIFIREYKLVKGQEKAGLAELKDAWNAAKADPKNKFFVDVTAKKINKYEGILPGQDIPDKEGYIMGENSRPVKKDKQTGINVMKKFPNGNGVEVTAEEAEESKGEDDAEDSDSGSGSDSGTEEEVEEDAEDEE